MPAFKPDRIKRVKKSDTCFSKKNKSKFEHIGFVRCRHQIKIIALSLRIFGRQADLCRYLSKNVVLDMLLIVIVAASAI